MGFFFTSRSRQPRHTKHRPAIAAGGPMRLIRRARGDTDGATAIEFALVAPVLFAFLLGTIELGIVYTANVLLKHATHDAARTGRTGYIPSEANQDEAIRARVKSKAGILMDVDKLVIESLAYADFDTFHAPEPFTDENGNGVWDPGEDFDDINGNGVYDGGRLGYGEADEVVLYTVTYPWKFFTPFIGNFMSEDGIVTLTATAVVQNEPY